MNTVDNIFQVAFLVKDGLVSTEYDENNYPTIRPINREEKERNANKLKTQAIASIDQEMCDKMIKKYNIKKPFLDYDRLDMTQP